MTLTRKTIIRQTFHRMNFLSQILIWPKDLKFRLIVIEAIRATVLVRGACVWVDLRLRFCHKE